MGQGTGIFNLMRNIGASVGIATVTTLLTRGTQAHQARLVSHLTPYDPAYQRWLEDARARGIATVTYVAPLRGDVPPPYVTEEYARFRRDAAALAAETGARFADLDSLVPSEAWGTTQASGFAGDAEIDFMHFRTEGHALLAGAVERLLRDALGDAT